jgi:hypothetical protein
MLAAKVNKAWARSAYERRMAAISIVKLNEDCPQISLNYKKK